MSVVLNSFLKTNVENVKSGVTLEDVWRLILINPPVASSSVSITTVSALVCGDVNMHHVA